MNFQNLDKIGDILVIPFFLLASIYFYNIPYKSNLEYLLMIFFICGFVLDILFTCIHLINQSKKSTTIG